MRLPLFQCSSDGPSSKDFMLLQTRWKAVLDSLVSLPTNDSYILPALQLKNGVTVINHLLGRKMQGWIITDITGAATIYRSAAFNDKTLTLTSNAAVTVNLEVF